MREILVGIEKYVVIVFLPDSGVFNQEVWKTRFLSAEIWLLEICLRYIRWA